MSSRKVVADFLKREAWHLVRYIDLGTTAHVFVVEKDGDKYRSCVQSLLWLNEESEGGLDGIGRAHSERQLSAL